MSKLYNITINYDGLLYTTFLSGERNNFRTIQLKDGVNARVSLTKKDKDVIVITDGEISKELSNNYIYEIFERDVDDFTEPITIAKYAIILVNHKDLGVVSITNSDNSYISNDDVLLQDNKLKVLSDDIDIVEVFYL